MAKGPPLLLLQGGAFGIESFGSNLDSLAESHRVIAPELQAHGRTKDVDPPLDFDQLADDVCCLLSRDHDLGDQVRGLEMSVIAADAVRLDHPLEFFRLLGGALRDGGLDGRAGRRACSPFSPGSPTTRSATTPPWRS